MHSQMKSSHKRAQSEFMCPWMIRITQKMTEDKLIQTDECNIHITV